MPWKYFLEPDEMKKLIGYSLTTCIESQSIIRSYFFEVIIDDIIISKKIQPEHKNELYDLLKDPIKMNKVFRYLRDQDYLRFLDVDKLKRCAPKNDMINTFLEDYQTIQNIEEVFNIPLIPSSKLDNENPIKTRSESSVHGLYIIKHNCVHSLILNNCKLDCTHLNSIIHYLKKLHHLKSLELKENKLNHLPATIGDLSSLKILNVSKNHISSLPDSFGKLSSLEFIRLNNNNITSLPSSFSNLKSLTHLYLYQNALKKFPQSILSLTSLEELNISINQLTILPPSIADLISLKNLSCAKNKLKPLPKSILQLPNLESIVLDKSLMIPTEHILRELKLKKIRIYYN